MKQRECLQSEELSPPLPDIPFITEATSAAASSSSTSGLTPRLSMEMSRNQEAEDEMCETAIKLEGLQPDIPEVLLRHRLRRGSSSTKRPRPEKDSGLVLVQDGEKDDTAPTSRTFHRTPSLQRKWRKRYGGLDGNKLLEPSEDADVKDDGRVSAQTQPRNPENQEAAPLPAPRSLIQSPVQKPVSLVSPGPAALPVSVINGCLKPPLPQAVVRPEDRSCPPPQPWAPPQQSPSKRRAAADVLFDSFASDGRLRVNRFFESIWSSGLHRSDPRLRECFFHLRKLQDAEGSVDRSTFHRCVTGFVSLVLKALQGRFVIPDFATFTEETQKLFSRCRQLSSVQDTERDDVVGTKWGVSICTVDGQRLSLGDWAGPVVLGELSWPLVYGVAVDLLGSDLVHRYVGMEEFSRHQSPFSLSKAGIPHSPLTETGAVVAASLLQLGGRMCAEEEKFDSLLNVIRRLCNKEHVSLNGTSSRCVQVSRLHALSSYLQERKCFPEKVDVTAAVDLLLQCCSAEVSCESGAAMAASLANGGLCPLSGDQVLSPASTRSMLSMMQVAGLKDYSSAFHYKASVPAASSSHGSLLAVVPGVLGLMAFSPELDACGNPWRAVHFCQELVSVFQLHMFDIRTPFRQILAYRQWKAESEGYQIMNVLLAAFKGDVRSLRRYFLSGLDVNAVDYDGRSALHVAAAEGHTEVIRFLLENAGANPALKDRWGSSPLQEARRHNKEAAVQLLQE